MQYILHLFVELCARQQHAPTTARAHQADIRPKAHHLPCAAAARMWLAQAHLITQTGLIA